jgi:hypothetical protein
MRAEVGGDRIIQVAARGSCRNLAIGCWLLQPSREAGPLTAWLEDGVQTSAQSDHVVSIAREPGMHPHRPIKKSQRRPICMSNSNAHY